MPKPYTHLCVLQTRIPSGLVFHIFLTIEARSLLSILRLSSAIAKLKLSDSVSRDDVQEAMRLVEMSKDSLKGTKMKKRQRQRPSDMIYQGKYIIICSYNLICSFI